MLGHLLGAAGAVETIATVLCVRDGVVPITRNLEDLDDDVELDVVVGRGWPVAGSRGRQQRLRLRRPNNVALVVRGV